MEVELQPASAAVPSPRQSVRALKLVARHQRSLPVGAAEARMPAPPEHWRLLPARALRVLRRVLPQALRPILPLARVSRMAWTYRPELEPASARRNRRAAELWG